MKISYSPTARWLQRFGAGMLVLGWLVTGAPAADAGQPQAQFVIVISVDGMGSAYVTPLLTRGLTNELTTFKRFQTEGAGTLNARTDADYAITLPNHTSMMTSRGVNGTNGHNWNSNGDPGAATIASNKGSYVASGFDVAHDNGLRTGIWAGKSKFNLFQQSYSATSGALDTTGIDNGRDKIDYDKVTDGIAAATLTTDFTNQMAASPFNFVFFHYHEPDTAGHSSGWSTNPSSAYAASLKAVDTQIGRIMQMVENRPTLQGKTAIILTSDHGGHGTTHGDMTNPLDYTIPFYVWGAGVTAGGDLYALNPASRTSPGTTNAPYRGGQPVRNGDAANLALDLLDLGVVPGSTIDSAQDLKLTFPPTPTITGISNLGGGNLTISGTADQSGQVVLLKTTRLDSPMWTPIQTNDVAAGVSFSFPVSQGLDPQACFRLMGQ